MHQIDFLAEQDQQAWCESHNPMIAVVVSRFNEDITNVLYQGAEQRLQALGVNPENITVIWVPGAVEIPVVAKRCAESKQYDAVICLGAVIYGHTDHYEYVCRQVSDGCQRVALDHSLPVIFGVLTTRTREHALERAGGAMGNYGHYSAEAAISMAATLATFPHAHHQPAATLA